jgi:hypothetical protein
VNFQVDSAGMEKTNTFHHISLTHIYSFYHFLPHDTASFAKFLKASVLPAGQQQSFEYVEKDT